MIFLPILLCVISFFLFLAIYFGISQVIQLNVYILHVCLGFAVILYHVITQTVPFDLIILLIVRWYCYMLNIGRSTIKQWD